MIEIILSIYYLISTLFCMIFFIYKINNEGYCDFLSNFSAFFHIVSTIIVTIFFGWFLFPWLIITFLKNKINGE
jgi:hypothetical protein